MCRRDDRDREEEEDTPPPLRLLTTAAAEGHDARREPTTLLWCAGSMRGCFRFRLIMARVDQIGLVVKQHPAPSSCS